MIGPEVQLFTANKKHKKHKKQIKQSIYNSNKNKHRYISDKHKMDQDELLLQFMGITAVEDVTTAHHYLEVCYQSHYEKQKTKNKFFVTFCKPKNKQTTIELTEDNLF